MRRRRALVATPYGCSHDRHTGAHHARTVVVSHSSQQSSALMRELLAALSDRVQAIAIAYPSCGMSAHVDTQPPLEDYAQCVMVAMEAAGGQRATAWGEATGAFVAAARAAASPERRDRAVRGHGPSYPDRGVSETAQASRRAGASPRDASGFPVTRTLDFVMPQDPAHAPVNADQSWMDRINVAQMEAGRERWQALQALGMDDLHAGLARVACPVLFLRGEQCHSRKDLPALVALARGAQSEVLPDARVCVTWSHASRIAERTLAFMGV